MAKEVNLHCIFNTNSIAYLEDLLTIFLCYNRKAIEKFYQFAQFGQTNWGDICFAELRFMGFNPDLLEASIHFISTRNIGTQDVVVDGICIWAVGSTEASQ